MEFKYLEEECVDEKKPLISKKGKRVLLVAFFTLIIVGTGRLVWMFGDQIKAASSVKTLEKDFYSMEYKGDYGFDELLENGGVSDDSELIAHIMKYLYHDMYAMEVVNGNYGCSTLRATMEDGTVLFGRNFDYNSCKTMVVTTEPENGYKSISTCNIEFFGMRNSWEPDDFMNKMMAISAVYAPVDGMNEKGVCVAVLSVSAGYPTDQNTDKPDITTTTAVRLILDKAASVDEAVELLEQYDMHASIGGRFKFAITDSTGKSVAVEYINNEMSVVEVDACSNFYQTPGLYYGMGLYGPCPRYAKLMEGYQAYNGRMTEDEMMNVMASASQKYFHHNNTQWTAVFHTKELTATYCYFEDFDTKYHFSLDSAYKSQKD